MRGFRQLISSALIIGLMVAVLHVACDGGMQQTQQTADMAAPPVDLSIVEVTSGMLSVLAGGLGGNGSLDGTGAAARFTVPYGMAADGAGNLYVADTTNNTIRKVVLASGVVTTLAGTPGVSGSTDGTGAAARFNAPYGVAVDGAGNLYVTDSSNNTIRKVVLASGLVTTLAGTAGMSGSADGTGAAARFTAPHGVAVDVAGNLYVADYGNRTIRKVVLASGAVSTLAGTAGMFGSTDGTGAAARFYLPEGAAVDGAGNLYVSDAHDDTIRQIVLASGMVTTLVGTAGMIGSTDGTGAAARFAGPGGLTVDGAGNLYVADGGNNTIRKVVLASGVVTTLTGTAGMVGSTDGTGAAARFAGPGGLTGDGAGNLYVADSGNNTIRKVVLANGVVTTVAGAVSMPGSTDGIGAAARFKSPDGVAADGAGNLYIADSGNNTIRKVVLASGVVTTVAGTAGVVGSTDGSGATARFMAPNAVAVDGAGDLYVADTSNNTIRKVVLASGVVTTVAGTAGVLGSVDGIGAAAQFNEPRGVAVDSAGNLYVADYGNNTIRKVVLASGVVTTLAGTAGTFGSADGSGATARFVAPHGVAVDSAGNLYVADTGNCTIRKVVPASGVVTTLAGTANMYGSNDGIGAAARFSVPIGVAVDGAGSLYVADFGNGTIRKVVLANGSVTTPIGVAGHRGVKPGPLPGGLNMPIAVTGLPGGQLVIVDSFENAVLVAQ